MPIVAKPSPDSIGTVNPTVFDMFDAAIPHLEASARKTPDNAVALYHLGMAYVKTGDFKNAESTLKKALALQPNFPGADEARTALATLGV